MLCPTDIYRAEPSRRRECLYYLALGHYKMGNYEEAKNFNGALVSRPLHLSLLKLFVYRNASISVALLLDREPANMQAQSLSGLIEKAVSRGASRFDFSLQRILSNLYTLATSYRRIHRHGSSSRCCSTRHTFNRRSHTASKQPQMIIFLPVNSLCLPPALFRKPHIFKPQNHGIPPIFALHHASLFIATFLSIHDPRSRHLRLATTQLSTIDGPTTRTGVRSSLIHRDFIASISCIVSSPRITLSIIPALLPCLSLSLPLDMWLRVVPGLTECSHRQVHGCRLLISYVSDILQVFRYEQRARVEPGARI